ncbi:hypothetical protein AM587_10003009 [Phytophthora nicotianae]|uniref:Uncharacterized protein n=2 Tax=Phytophthora nicotianae TaxID=4792 RepID=A0A0W8D6H3_PHYNI|nr:hypothetical protein AM587_10003009 [Phytophthora nicotianae]
MVEAASTNQLGWLNSLVKQYDAHVSDAVLLAARIGDIKSLELLTPYMDELKDVKREAFEEVVLAASKSGNADVVRLLLPELGGEGLAWSVIMIAAGKGFMEILSFAADAADSGYEMSYVLLYAIYRRQSEAAIFLASRYYRDWNLGEGLESALVYGLNEVADCIYGIVTEHEDGDSFIWDFFTGLAGDGYGYALTYLYHLDKMNLICSVALWSLHNHVQIHSTYRDGRITQESIEEAFRNAAGHGNSNSIQLLFQNCGISTRGIRKAFENSSTSTISKFLYDKLEDPAESVVAAFRNAAGCGHYIHMSHEDRAAVFKFLCSTGHVPDKLVHEGIIAAIGNWYLFDDVVLALFNEAYISPEIALRVFQKAVSEGRARVVKLLLSKYCFALPVKEEAMMNAAQGDQDLYFEVLKLICASEDWSLDALNRAISTTTNSRALAILQVRKAAKETSSS